MLLKPALIKKTDIDYFDLCKMLLAANNLYADTYIKVKDSSIEGERLIGTSKVTMIVDHFNLIASTNFRFALKDDVTKLECIRVVIRESTTDMDAYDERLLESLTPVNGETKYKNTSAGSIPSGDCTANLNVYIGSTVPNSTMQVVMKESTITFDGTDLIKKIKLSDAHKLVDPNVEVTPDPDPGTEGTGSEDPVPTEDPAPVEDPAP